MKLTYDAGAGTIRIFGEAYGGRETETSSDYVGGTGLYSIDFTYRHYVLATDGTGDKKLDVTSGHNDNEGTISWTHSNGPGGAPGSVDFTDFPLSGAPTFHIGNNHRGVGGLSGWGWVGLGSNGSYTHTNYQDWLFTMNNGFEPPPEDQGEPDVPEPTSFIVWSLLACVGMTTARRRRRR